MKLFWKASSLGLFVCGLLFTGAIFTGCYSSPIDPIFSDNPIPPVIPVRRLRLYCSGGCRFHVGDNVQVTLSGLPTPIDPHQESIKETAPSPCPISSCSSCGQNQRASFKTKSIIFMCRNVPAISPSLEYRRSRLLRHR